MTDLRRRLKARREELRLRQEDVAEAMGLTKQAISHYETGKRPVKVKHLGALARTLGVSPQWLLYGDEGGKAITLLTNGEIGAGGVVVRDTQRKKTVPVPPGADGDSLEAFEMTGDAMAPRFHPGDIIYTNAEGELGPACYQRPCIVQLEDGRELLRIVHVGDRPETVHLTAHNAPSISNAIITRCTPVLFTYHG